METFSPNSINRFLKTLIFLINTIWLLFALPFLARVTITSFGIPDLVIIGLSLIPLITLIGVIKIKKENSRYVKFAEVYCGAASILLISHALTMNVLGTHPIAFAITEQVFSVIFSLFSAVNLGLLIWIEKNQQKE